jgi:hypothetical protein
LSGLIDRLFAAPDGVNAAVEMSRRVAEMASAGELNPDRVQELLPEIGVAAELGERDLDAANAALGSLRDAGAIASKEVPFGF